MPPRDRYEIRIVQILPAGMPTWLRGTWMVPVLYELEDRRRLPSTMRFRRRRAAEKIFGQLPGRPSGRMYATVSRGQVVMTRVELERAPSPP